MSTSSNLALIRYFQESNEIYHSGIVDGFGHEFSQKFELCFQFGKL